MEKFSPELSSQFAKLLLALTGKKLAIVGHARPDGDCIGSQSALTRVLRALGYDVICVNPDPVPRRLQFLVRDLAFTRPDDVEAGEYAVIYSDCADQDRAGEKVRARFPNPVANIDHHISNSRYADHNFIDVGAAATCEILAAVFLDNKYPIDAATAQALFVGIMTDTGQFRFNSTTRRTFMLAAELVALGANPADAGGEIYERESAGKLQLVQRFLSSFKMECGGRVCIGILPDGIFDETGTSPEDTEGLVDYARAIDGVDIGVLIEVRANVIKSSLRSKNPAFRVDQLAAQFGGGGHACAAGLNIKSTTLAEFRPRLLAALEAQLARVTEPTD
ncbi:MAG: bifunctional oligoribonuclease/PAP phosphatase NrnA [Verrucomicrobia bacterium]|nr:bifunctional oligoribonuclease/PAP phosphatase NrnA [Verrucomicrobiota bacterium]